MTGDENPREQLRRRITRGIVLQTGTCEQIAMQYADAVMVVLDDVRAANGTIYVPAVGRQYDVLQIKAALERGVSRRDVRRNFSVSDRTLNRMFPGGLPRPRQDSGKIGEAAR